MASMSTAASNRGLLYGFAAAALFGVSSPLLKAIGASGGNPLALAGALYLGAGLVLGAFRWVRPNSTSTEARIRRADAAPLVGIVLLGGMAGPVLLLVGLSRLTGTTSSLLLNLEGPFTLLLAVTLFREHLPRRALLGALLIFTGAGVLGLEPRELRPDLYGALAIAGACGCWAVDNNLTQKLSLKDPLQIVRFKALAAGAGNLAIVLVITRAALPVRALLFASGVGALCYAASLVLDVYALRLIGAAKEAAIFASAPLFGVIGSVIILVERPGLLDGVALALMGAGVWNLVRSRHGHLHEHAPMEHEHLHVHDAHHQHAHGPNDPAGEPHSHPHTHARLIHDHPHESDAHHRHSH